VVDSKIRLLPKAKNYRLGNDWKVYFVRVKPVEASIVTIIYD